MKIVVAHQIDDRIKRPKTQRYPSLKGTDPKFRRNHRHALHGTMKALVGPLLSSAYLYWVYLI